MYCLIVGTEKVAENGGGFVVEAKDWNGGAK
jgi:hypothetical protein